MKINNVILPNCPPDQRFTIVCSSNKLPTITQIEPFQDDKTDTPPSLVLPALCHPHIHLDKAYLLTSNPYNPDKSYPSYSDLALEKGTFSEALSKTSAAKSRYTVPDLVLRGSQMIAESIQAGVTSIRAFVELDHVTEMKTLDAAVELKNRFKEICHVQICAFAQDPVMSGDFGNENRTIIEKALEDDRYAGLIDVLGCTPYVEESFDGGLKNVEWAVKLAMKKGLHVDFHLDYNVDGGQKAMVWDVIRILKESGWKEQMSASGKRIVIGHCTRMTLFSKEEMRKLRTAIDDLPIAFVGLPSSDLFMMGRPEDEDEYAENRQRGTMQILDLIKEYDIEACIGVNNVGNAFTPWGNVDPLRLASLGVGLYQAGTEKDAKLLYECVSTRAERAIGLCQSRYGDGGSLDDLKLALPQDQKVLIVSNEERLHIAGAEDDIPARQRLTVKDVVWDPPESRLRRVLG